MNASSTGVLSVVMVCNAIGSAFQLIYKEYFVKTNNELKFYEIAG